MFPINPSKPGEPTDPLPSPSTDGNPMNATQMLLAQVLTFRKRSLRCGRNELRIISALALANALLAVSATTRNSHFVGTAFSICGALAAVALIRSLK